MACGQEGLVRVRVDLRWTKVVVAEAAAVVAQSKAPQRLPIQNRLLPARVSMTPFC